MTRVSFLAEPLPWLGLLLVMGATLALRPLALRLGWADDPARDPEAARKLQPRAVPVVGGTALLLGVLVVLLLDPRREPPGAGFLVALVGVWLVGLVDDLRSGGLRPGPKLLLQALAGLPWALAVGDGPLGVLAAVAAVLLALNLANTFDNADGALASLGLVGLLAAGSPLAGAVAGFLPCNLRRGGRPALAYLGDSGSHLLGFCLLATPGAWPVLCLPALDLARLCVVRPLAGSAPWIGDRRHLAHRLQRRGWTAPRVALLLAACSAPALLVGHSWWGPAATAAVFAALALLPAPAEVQREPRALS